MKPVKTDNTNVVYGSAQDEYMDLPANKTETGDVVVCWELTDEEIAEVVKTKKIYHRQLTFNQPLQPILLSAENLVE